MSRSAEALRHKKSHVHVAQGFSPAKRDDYYYFFTNFSSALLTESAT